MTSRVLWLMRLLPHSFQAINFKKMFCVSLCEGVSSSFYFFHLLGYCYKYGEKSGVLDHHPLQRKKTAVKMELRAMTPIFFLAFLLFPIGEGGLTMKYYSKSCPRAEEIVKEQVHKLYDEHGNTAVSWIRNLFHDCMVKSCDASLLLETTDELVSEQESTRSFGMRNFKYIKKIKDALEKECPSTVSCADIVALSARDGIARLGGPYIPMKTGRKDSKESFRPVVEKYIPDHNDSISLVLSRFGSMGIDAEGVVALLGAHSVGRVHCMNLVHRLYPTVDPTIDPEYGEYLRGRCPTPHPDPKEVLYSRNDRKTPMVVDNMYHKNLVEHKGLLLVDQQLLSHPATSKYVIKMAESNDYFYQQFSQAVLKMSENNPLSGDEGEVRKDCRYVNGA